MIYKTGFEHTNNLQAGPGLSLPPSLIFIFFAILEYESDFSILIDEKIGQTGFTEKKAKIGAKKIVCIAIGKCKIIKRTKCQATDPLLGTISVFFNLHK